MAILSQGRFSIKRRNAWLGSVIPSARSNIVLQIWPSTSKSMSDLSLPRLTAIEITLRRLNGLLMIWNRKKRHSGEIARASCKGERSGNKLSPLHISLETFAISSQNSFRASRSSQESALASLERG